MDIKKQQTIGTLFLGIIFLCLVLVTTPSSDEKRGKQAEKKEEKKALSFVEKTKAYFETTTDSAKTPHFFQLSGKEVTYHLSSLGARITKATLKHHKNAEGELVALYAKNSGLGIELTDGNKQKVHTHALIFDGEQDRSGNRVVFTHGKGTDRSIQLTYEVKGPGLAVGIKLGRGWHGDTTTYLRQLSDLQNQEQYIDKVRGETCVYYGKKGGGYGHTSRLRHIFSSKDPFVLKGVTYLSCYTPYFLESIITNAPGIASKVALKENTEPGQTIKTVAIEMAFPTQMLQKGHTLTYYFGENTAEALRVVDKGCVDKVNFSNQLPSARLRFFPFFSLANRYVVAPFFHLLYGATKDPLVALFLLLFLVFLLVGLLGYRDHLHKLKMKVAKPFITAAKAKDESNSRMVESMFYRQLGINPLALFLRGFVNLLLMVAIMIFLRYEIVFRGVPFLWIADVSTYDGFISLPFRLPMLGQHISILGLIALALTFLFKEETTFSIPGAGADGLSSGMKSATKYLFMFMSFLYFNRCMVVIGISRLFRILYVPLQKKLFNRIVDGDKITREVMKKIAKVENEKQPSLSRSLSRLEKRMKK